MMIASLFRSSRFGSNDNVERRGWHATDCVHGATLD